MPLVLLSSLAEGGDHWVAEEALALGLRLIAPLPMMRAQYAQDFTDSDARARFDRLSAQAGIIEVPIVMGDSPLARTSRRAARPGT